MQVEKGKFQIFSLKIKERACRLRHIKTTPDTKMLPIEIILVLELTGTLNVMKGLYFQFFNRLWTSTLTLS